MSALLWKGLLPPALLVASLMLFWHALPIELPGALALSMLASLLCLFLGWQLHRRSKLAAAQSDASEVVLVGGPAAITVMGGYRSREGLAQRWVLLNDAEQLATCTDQGALVRGLIIAIEPDQLPSGPQQDNMLSTWQHAWYVAQRKLGYPLPATLLILGAFEQAPATLAPVSSGNVRCFDLVSARQLLDKQQQALTTLTYATPPDTRTSAMSRAMTLHYLMQHVSHQILPRLLPEKSHRHAPSLHGLAWLDSGRSNPHSAWQQQANADSGLIPQPQQQPWPADAPLPEEVVSACFPPQYHCPLWLRRLGTLAIIAALFFMAFSLSSAWHNLQLIRQTERTIQAFTLLQPDQEPMRGQAAQAMQALQSQLMTQMQYGVPLRLGVGLYQGAKLADVLNNMLRQYHPPKPEPEVIRLDNTALFDTGQSVLKPDAKLAMQSVLVWIQANPSKRVLIDGHTDSVGSAAANMKLSLARAQAVKNWLVNASTFDETHFAVQGLGDTRPLANNDDAEGRSQNRRVEITLIQAPDLK